MEYKTTQFTVDELKIEATKIGIKGGGNWHTLWKEYQGTPTDGYLTYQKMGDITGQFVEIEYYEKPNPKNEKYPFKTITKIKPTIKSTEAEKVPKGMIKLDPGISIKSEPDWDRINADKQHSIVLQVAMKLAVQSFPPTKAKLTDADYEEIEVRMVKFNAIMEKYLGGVTMKEPKKNKFSPLVQAKWNEFDKYIEENKAIGKDSYKKVRNWLDRLTDPTTKVLTEQLAKLNASLEPKVSSKYKSYHESLITACCDTLKTKDRLPVIQTLTNMVKAWDIKGLEELSDTSENQCLNLLEEFDKQLKEEDEENLPY